MTNFRDLSLSLKKLNLPPDQFVVIGSGPMAVRGIRETDDLDIMVSSSLWDELITKYPQKVDHGIAKLDLGSDIEVSGAGSAYDDPKIASFSEMMASADVIDGVRYLSLDLLKKFKQKIGRDKDLRDIDLISKFRMRRAPKE
jgi:hypothetical protein